MSVNASSNSSLHPQLDHCSDSRNISLFTALFISFILLLPLFILVLYMGFQRWRKQRSVATAATMSHSDIFTFNIVALDLISFLGLCFIGYGIRTNEPTVLAVGMYIYLTTPVGQTLFHLLTCVERYLAVVHPITYLELKQSGRIRIRNIVVGCVWLSTFVSQSLFMNNRFNLICFNTLFLVISSSVAYFCSLSVLCVLIRPGPGEKGGNRVQVDQSKQRAFYTIMAITGALTLRFLSNLVITLLSSSPQLSFSDTCLMMWSVLLLNLPSSLVLPLLFLHRAGKLSGCKHNTESGWGQDWSSSNKTSPLNLI